MRRICIQNKILTNFWNLSRASSRLRKSMATHVQKRYCFSRTAKNEGNRNASKNMLLAINYYYHIKCLTYILTLLQFINNLTFLTLQCSDFCHLMEIRPQYSSSIKNNNYNMYDSHNNTEHCDM